MTEDEKRFLESVVNFKADVNKVQNYVFDTMGVDSVYDDKENVIHLYTENINEALNVATAKEYVERTLGDKVTVVCGVKWHYSDTAGFVEIPA